MLKKKAFAFMAALLMTASAAGCGKKEPAAEHQPEVTTAEETTEPTTTAAGEKKYDKDGKGIDLTLGMLSYVKKSKKSSANATASTLYKAINTVLVDKGQKFADNVIYSHTDGTDELNKYMHDTYYSPEEDIEYIMSADDDGYPLWLLCSKNTKKDDYVGVFGGNSRADELREMNWADVLKIYGYEQGKYSDIRLEKDESAYNTQPAQKSISFGDGRTINYQELDNLDLMALSIGMEYDFGTSQKPFYLYGVFGKDEPFTADVPWEMPEHGDVEFVIEMEGVQIGRVMCWETGTDKSLVGSYNLHGGRYYLSDSSWDEILEYFGYTQGEYVEY